MEADLFGLVTEAVAAYSSRAAAPPQPSAPPADLIPLPHCDPASHRAGRHSLLCFRGAIPDLMPPPQPSAPQALDVERLGAAMGRVFAGSDCEITDDTVANIAAEYARLPQEER